jgi:peptidoglycan/LPS O-acetylase OafA/YrhL
VTIRFLASPTPVGAPAAIHAGHAYRPDIDGLRTVAVAIVILFHLRLAGFAGGFVGVDVFFVISGFLIGGIVRRDVAEGRFRFGEFYLRRVLRIAPALAVTLIGVLVAGFLLDTQDDFDFLGKQTLFAAIGLSNFLFAERTDYFAAETPQLIHTWSLGVEEQFYFVFPALALGLWRVIGPRTALAVAALAVATTFLPLLEPDATRRYFLPQYRIFELLAGVALAYHPALRLPGWAPALGLALIAAAVALTDEATPFPGPMTLLPVVGAMLIVAPGADGPARRLLSARPMVWLGLVSYPLYLVHQPVIFYLAGLADPLRSLLAVSLSLALATAIYHVVEGPVRRLPRGARGPRLRTAFGALACLGACAAIGLHAARNNGWPWRFDMLNPFAAEVAAAHRFEFDHVMRPGFASAADGEGAVLVTGDSIAQQYAPPLARALGLPLDAVETATRHGCVTLAGVDMVEAISHISCAGVREALYASKRRWDLVVVGQAWAAAHYGRSILNMDQTAHHEDIRRWEPFLRATLDALAPRADRVVILGWPMRVQAPFSRLEPSVFLSRDAYRAALEEMRFEDDPASAAGNAVFLEIAAAYPNVFVVDPRHFLCGGDRCISHDDRFSFFRDPMHTTMHAAGALAVGIRGTALAP